MNTYIAKLHVYSYNCPIHVVPIVYIIINSSVICIQERAINYNCDRKMLSHGNGAPVDALS